jgi:hypothetical protein
MCSRWHGALRRRSAPENTQRGTRRSINVTPTWLNTNPGNFTANADGSLSGTNTMHQGDMTATYEWYLRPLRQP